MALSEEFLEQIRNANEITSLISSYTALKRAGRDSVCLCPFHSEKTPSCHIYSDTQSFYCFGCGAGGDAITFIRLIERLDYLESVRFLAQRAGIDMPYEEYDQSGENRRRLLEINKAAARFYRDILISEAGFEGRRYLRERGLNDNTVRKYGLGYAPKSWDALKKHMLSCGYGENELIDAALLSRGQKNNSYDKFRNRIMFPIIDRRGNIIAFGGRTLESDEGAKYINSDETLVFHKRTNLFSLNFAKNTKEKFLILCEGYMDVISLNQAGFDNSIATLGTAITAEQARLMRQYCEQAVISYDSDEAGQKATIKAINLLGEAGIETRVLQMNGAKDPDEYIKKYGPDGFRILLEQSGGAIGFELKKLTVGLDIEAPEGRAAYLKKAVKLLADIDNRIDRLVYISDTAKLCGISSIEIERAVEEQRQLKSRNLKKRESEALINPSKTNKTLTLSPLSPVQKAQCGVIAFILHSPDFLAKIENEIKEEDFEEGFYRNLYKSLLTRIKSGLSIELSALGSEFSVGDMGKITGIIKENSLLPYQKERLREYIGLIIKNKNKQTDKKPEEMTDEELRKTIESIKKQKNERLTQI